MDRPIGSTENVFRDGDKLVVPIENAIFPLRCVKTNQNVKSCDQKLTLECSTMNLTQSGVGTAARVIGGKTAKTVLAAGEMLATRKKFALQIGLCESKKTLYRKLKYGSFGLLAAGPIVFAAILIPVIQIAEANGTKPNAVLSIIAAVLGAVLFISGIVLFGISSLGLLRPTYRSDSHAWLDGACKEFLDSLPTSPPQEAG